MRNPQIYPPKGDSRCPIPAENPEKTGSPTAPSIMYSNKEAVPPLPPRSKRAQYTPKVCKVKGTGEGIIIHEQRMTITVTRGILMRFRVFEFFIVRKIICRVMSTKML